MIRKMCDQDWTRVAEIYKQGIEEGKSTFETECPTFAQWDNNHIKTCRYVYEEDNTVVGWIALSHTSTRRAYSGVAEVSLYIDRQYQNRGIGKQLLDKVCEESEKEGFWCLYSSIFSINEASINLHKKCGFREIGYREKIAKDRFGQWQNTTLMERRNNIEV